MSGDVRTCISKVTRETYALKTLHKVVITAEQLATVRQEIYMMAKLDHPNILRIHECFETDSCIMLVLPLCRGGELLDRLNQQTGHKYNEAIACKYVKTIVGAIRYCHAHGICHRDLKLENFLFEDESEGSDLKVDSCMHSSLPLSIHTTSLRLNETSRH